MFPSVDAFPAFMLSSCGPKIPVMSKQFSTAGAGVSLSAPRTDRLRAHTPISGDMTGSIASSLRHQRFLIHLDRRNEPAFGREAELQEVIDDLEARLASIGGIGIPDVFEKELAAIEALAAPYAIALFYEIGRLGRLLLLRRRFVRTLGARRNRTTGSQIGESSFPPEPRSRANRHRRLTGTGQGGTDSSPKRI